MQRNDFDLSGRVALVTGSSRGIGRALAVGLADAGADVAVHCISRLTDGEDTARQITAKGRRSRAVAADLGSSRDCRRLIEEVVASLGGIDILVLNASIEIRSDWTAVSEADLDSQFAVNLRSTLLLLQATVPAMAARGWGRVVTLGSIQEAKPNPRLMVYAALKAAQTNFLVNLARNFGESGVTFNNLAPGAIATERNAAVLADAEYRQKVLQQIPARRIGTPDDCLGACLLLCSDAGRYINGATLPVDGGWRSA